MRRAIALTLVLAACAGSTRTLSAALGTIAPEADAMVTSLEWNLDQPLGAPTNFVRRISQLGITVVAGDLYDRVTRVKPTGVETDLARYTAFVGDVLLAGGELDTALAATDLTGVALAWLRIEATAGALAAVLDPADCPNAAPQLVSDLCRPEGEPGYDAGLEAAVRRFLSRYRPVMRLPSAFDEGVRGRVAVIVAPEVVAAVDDALARLATLTPPASHAKVHQSFVDHLVVLRRIWSDAAAGAYATPVKDGARVDAPSTLDWESLQADLTAAACEASIAFVAGRVSLRAAEPTSPIAALGALWLYGVGTGCP